MKYLDLLPITPTTLNSLAESVTPYRRTVVFSSHRFLLRQPIPCWIQVTTSIFKFLTFPVNHMIFPGPKIHVKNVKLIHRRYNKLDAWWWSTSAGGMNLEYSPVGVNRTPNDTIVKSRCHHRSYVAHVVPQLLGRSNCIFPCRYI